MAFFQCIAVAKVIAPSVSSTYPVSTHRPNDNDDYNDDDDSNSSNDNIATALLRSAHEHKHALYDNRARLIASFR